jgi:hypothetical protein
VSESGEIYEQDAHGRVLMNGYAISRAPLAAFGTPRLLLESEVRRHECVAFLFMRELPHGSEFVIRVTRAAAVLGITPVTLPSRLGRPGWLHLARIALVNEPRPSDAA